MRNAAACISLILAIEAGVIAGMVPRGTASHPSAVGQQPPASLSHVGAMLTVEGTGIREPVIQASEQEGNSFYLHHDINGAESYAGAIFADARCVQPSQHLLFYGHSFGYGTSMFSELKHAWQNDVFESIGQARLTINGTTHTYYPVAALHVDASYDPIQRFSFSNTDELRVWLKTIADEAQATTEKSAGIIARAQHVVSLVTCSDVHPGKPGRTVVVFVSVNPGKIRPLPCRS